MTEVIHEHVAADSGSNTAMTFMIGILMLIVIAAVAFYFLGAGRFFGGFNSTANTGGSVPQVNVPEKIDVNVNSK